MAIMILSLRDERCYSNTTRTIILVAAIHTTAVPTLPLLAAAGDDGDEDNLVVEFTNGVL